MYKRRFIAFFSDSVIRSSEMAMKWIKKRVDEDESGCYAGRGTAR
jgi:hypothetical protein